MASKTLSQPLQLDEAAHRRRHPRLVRRQSLHYQLILEEDATVTLEMRSDDFGHLPGAGGQGRHLHDDDGGQGTNSRLRQRLSAGEVHRHAQRLRRRAIPASSNSTSTSPASEPTDESLPFDAPIQAWLDPGAMNEYVIDGEAGRYRLDMTSGGAGRLSRELEGEGLSLQDDDGGNGFTHVSRAHPGVYRAIARSFNRDTGPIA
ncbi:hypothetical protein DSL92_03110 [Billgrantia gudaonensis]|uniref:Uncharacterized protein n=1 Tax=Billgrantia gudaonensis TaxID=376427 RepID=A0A3S0R598_9GAMM|nr:hypothetical protein DSL92_03110 [Halomonas gudaonensis]